ncbi:DUF2703 domain-containing protein [Zoogloea sp. LCSB751]|uniref:DUF2703 domain-containing protein n=1 Tax=Zoogloea sp. LCSB751 TaxID=1965277 RepID=UPI0009A4C57F|nr:DUF2703 domain-containing protein [Zoogloea sp. LCSB751]
MKRLPIVWQRLVTNGETCPRCADTGDAIHKATQALTAALAPLGMVPELEMRELDEAHFKAEPSASNRIWIAGKPMEDWLQASVGSSPCCSVCGDSECRTMAVDGQTFEAIPQELLVKAALIAALTLHSQPDR